VGALWVYGCVGDSAVIHPGPYRDHRYFKPEVMSALEKRLLRDMQADKGEMERSRFRPNLTYRRVIRDLLRRGKVNEEPQMWKLWEERSEPMLER